MKTLMYSAVVLDEESKNILQKKFSVWFGNRIPDWTLHCDHMTINIGSLLDEYKHMKHSSRKLYVTHLGISDMAIAIKVTGCPSVNKIPHITLAVNTEKGGKARMSNEITNWVKVKGFYVSGVVEGISS